jgi:large subunit ribosomal protein L18
MAKKKTRALARKRRHIRVRKQIHGTAEKPRLNVYRSLNEIYAQLIDDNQGHTLVSASTIDGELKKKTKGMTKKRTGNPCRPNHCGAGQEKGHQRGRL